jgi:quinol monooxygenase YgiN
MKNKVMKLVLVLMTLLSGQAFASDQSVSPTVSSTSNEPIVVIAIVKVKPGTEQSFKASAAKIIAPTRKESGNIDYNFQQSTSDPTEFATVEHWKSQADIDAHMKTAPMLNFFQEVGSDFEAGYPVITEYNSFEN